MAPESLNVAEKMQTLEFDISKAEAASSFSTTDHKLKALDVDQVFKPNYPSHKKKGRLKSFKRFEKFWLARDSTISFFFKSVSSFSTTRHQITADTTASSLTSKLPVTEEKNPTTEQSTDTFIPSFQTYKNEIKAKKLKSLTGESAPPSFSKLHVKLRRWVFVNHLHQ